MGDLEVRTTARLQYAEEGRDLQWRHFYQEDIAALYIQFQKAHEECDFWQRVDERMTDAYTQLSFWARALNRQSDKAIERAEAAEALLEQVNSVRTLIPHSYPDKPVYYPDKLECRENCQRCSLDEVLLPAKAQTQREEKDEDNWVNMEKFHPCPVCGNEEICFGPPTPSGGHYQIDAVYCEVCGTVFQVAHWSEQGGTRFAELKRVD